MSASAFPIARSPSGLKAGLVVEEVVDLKPAHSAADALTVTIWLARDQRAEAADPIAIRRKVDMNPATASPARKDIRLSFEFFPPKSAEAEGQL